MRYLFSLGLVLLVSTAFAAEKPNFVLFVTDDQRADCLVRWAFAVEDAEHRRNRQ